MFSMSQLIRRLGRNNPQMLATQDGGRARTWSEFNDRVARFAGGLRNLGVAEDTTVAVLALNSDRYFESMFAVPWAGGVFQPVNTRLASPEIIHWLSDADARVLLVDSTFAPMIEEIRDDLPRVTRYVFMDEGELPDFCMPYDELVAAGPVPDAGRGGNDIAGLFYTGGTTGRSKGVMLTHDNLIINSIQAIPCLGAKPGDRILHVAPMFHIADACVSISSAIISGSNYFQPGFEPVATMEAIAQFRIERMLMVPTMINIFVNHPAIGDYDLSSLRTVVYGASPMPEAVIGKAMKELPEAAFYQGYGQTETAPIITVLPWERHTFEGPLAGKIKSAGQAVPGVDLEIMDGNHKLLGPDMVGEICMRGPNVMKGYRNLEEQTRNTIIDGWLHTGDSGYLDEDGFLFIVDRVKDMIISGGENVYSIEVENAIYRHTAVSQCAVIGIPDEKWGERVHAIVVTHEGRHISEDELIEHCRSLIAGFKCPRSISFRRDPLPLSGAGKILKTELRKPYWQGRDKAVN